MKKPQARPYIDSLGLPTDQKAAAYRTISRATSTEDIDIVKMANGDLIIRRTRPGKVGYQEFEDTIRPDGSKTVVQKAFDNAGNLVHFDPKGAKP